MRISVEELRNVKGIGDKTIERVYEYLEEQGELKRFKSEYKPDMHIDEGLYRGDCLDLMFGIPDKSIDMILCDLPYGTTACSWDEVIPFEPLWSHYKRIIKDNGVIVLFGKEPFTTKIITSNFGNFKQKLIWRKDNHDNPMQSKKRHLNVTEDIVVFYTEQCTYNPQGIVEVNQLTKQGGTGQLSDGRSYRSRTYFQQYTNYPNNILDFKRNTPMLHPTQKPVELCEYLLKTYTNKGDMVLDNCMGSGTTGVACKNTGRRFIGMELDEKYFEIAKERIY